jgi:hypothetical protein
VVLGKNVEVAGEREWLEALPENAGIVVLFRGFWVRITALHSQQVADRIFGKHSKQKKGQRVASALPPGNCKR